MTTFIEVIDNALPAQLCSDIINTFDASGQLAPGRTGGGVDTDKKRSMDVSFSQNPEFQAYHQQVFQVCGNAIFNYLKKYYFAIVGPLGLTLPDPNTGQPVKLTSENFETLGLPQLPMLIQHLFRLGDINTQRYEKGHGGYPYWHSEVFPQAPHNEALHRILLFMFYLNDVEEGGSTDFYYQNVSIQPKAGRMVIAPAYFTHTHRGQIPVSDNKYILTSWVLFNRAEQLYG
ncbi:2OG-Fe(II) oxygenase [Alteromonas sp. AMM-1]|uniref:2OG-Fe(II) oxygenase n=1 Tax=Alteromonas sp. AMM-1 TaxID=3394233 RepID=UPI0039A45C48